MQAVGKCLNNDFYNTAFNSSEQGKIEITTLPNENNPVFGTDGGSSTSDKVFLLSTAESEKYFSSDEVRRCAPTDYAKRRMGYRNNSFFTVDGEATCYWLLRSPGVNSDYAARVTVAGSVDVYGDYVRKHNNEAVRPALWVNLSSVLPLSKPKSTPTPSLSTVDIGDIIELGYYEQQKIEWRILAKKEKKPLSSANLRLSISR